MTTETKTMTLKNWIINFKSQFNDGFSDYDSAEEEADDILKTDKKRFMAEFKKFAPGFIEGRNILNKGHYDFVSCDGEVFTYTITK